MIPFLHIGPLTIPTFGLCVASALVAAFFLLRADLRRRGIEAEAESLVAIPAFAGIIGAKLYHVLESPRELFANPIGEIFSQFGFAWFGGLIGGVVAFFWIARRIAKQNAAAGRPTRLLEILDAGSPAAALGYGIGRIGCLLAGDGDYGIPTSLPWGMSFPNGLVPTTQRVHPTPIYELIVACIIAWGLWRLGARAVAERRKLMQAEACLAGKGAAAESGGKFAAGMLHVSAYRDGIVFAQYLIWTGIARFLVEFIRINPRSFFGLTNAQAASVVSIVAGLVLWWRLPRR
ncbi:MAG TPA: prolipoprotein diacylglyceryl transferase [Candidatus Acidoferrum sp.]|nr:prolipoprotein diacylglyceryl transferase [Candidatus Acidoferrum sp.]